MWREKLARETRLWPGVVILNSKEQSLTHTRYTILADAVTHSKKITSVQFSPAITDDARKVAADDLFAWPICLVSFRFPDL